MARHFPRTKRALLPRAAHTAGGASTGHAHTDHALFGGDAQADGQHNGALDDCCWLRVTYGLPLRGPGGGGGPRLWAVRASPACKEQRTTAPKRRAQALSCAVGDACSTARQSFAETTNKCSAGSFQTLGPPDPPFISQNHDGRN
jgi:hypothetical protein